MAWRSSSPSANSPPFPSPSQHQQDQEQDEAAAAALRISDQRTLYLVNIFIGNTVRFLNSYSSLCEEKLSQLHGRISRLDATLTLLEAKLEGTRPYQEVGDSSCRDSEEPASSLPSRADSSLKGKILDAPFERGESSSC